MSLGGVQFNTKVVRNHFSKQKFCATKARSVKRLNDMSHMRRKIQGDDFFLLNATITRSDVWDKRPSSNSSEHLSSNKEKCFESHSENPISFINPVENIALSNFLATTPENQLAI